MQSMNKENTLKLMAEFPRLLRMRITTPTPLQARGIETGDGWYELIHELLSNIQSAALAVGLDETKPTWPRILQIKSKFGGLRTYIDASALYETHVLSKEISDLDTVRNLIATAEAKSLEICEECGSPGKLYKNAWWHVKCDACEALIDENGS